LNHPVKVIRHEDPGKGNHIAIIVQAPELANQQSCCGEIRK